ncbi:MAG: hypothetical protein M3Y33_00485 [Actinomycetota bacterium]|nr:hypothetical protein [Actinomycetota bacterium]
MPFAVGYGTDTDNWDDLAPYELGMDPLLRECASCGQQGVVELRDVEGDVFGVCQGHRPETARSSRYQVVREREAS